jgi:hypothetical protein
MRDCPIDARLFKDTALLVVVPFALMLAAARICQDTIAMKLTMHKRPNVFAARAVAVLPKTMELPIHPMSLQDVTVQSKNADVLFPVFELAVEDIPILVNESAFAAFNVMLPVAYVNVTLAKNHCAATMALTSDSLAEVAARFGVSKK